MLLSSVCRCSFWEPIDLTRRVALTGCVAVASHILPMAMCVPSFFVVLTSRRYVLLIDEGKHFLRLIVAMLVSLGYLILLMRIQPYARPEDDLLACISQMGLVLIFFCGILMESFQSLSDQAGVEAAQASMGFDSTDSIVTAMICCTSGMILSLFVAILVEGVKSYRLALVRSKWACAFETSSPYFEWRAHGDYACFLRCAVPAEAHAPS